MSARSPPCWLEPHATQTRGSTQVKRKCITVRALRGALAAAALLFAASASAQSYPAKPVRIIVPYGVGTATDTAARVLAQKLSQAWGKAVTVEAIPGAGGVVGTEALVKAQPDGYTLGVVAGAHAINAALYHKLPFDSLKDFRPVMNVAYTPLVLVANPALPVRNIRDLISLAEAGTGETELRLRRYRQRAASGDGIVRADGQRALYPCASYKNSGAARRRPDERANRSFDDGDLHLAIQHPRRQNPRPGRDRQQALATASRHAGDRGVCARLRSQGLDRRHPRRLACPMRLPTRSTPMRPGLSCAPTKWPKSLLGQGIEAKPLPAGRFLATCHQRGGALDQDRQGCRNHPGIMRLRKCWRACRAQEREPDGLFPKR